MRLLCFLRESEDAKDARQRWAYRVERRPPREREIRRRGALGAYYDTSSLVDGADSVGDHRRLFISVIEFGKIRPGLRWMPPLLISRRHYGRRPGAIPPPTPTAPPI